MDPIKLPSVGVREFLEGMFVLESMFESGHQLLQKFQPPIRPLSPGANCNDLRGAVYNRYVLDLAISPHWRAGPRGSRNGNHLPQPRG
jgi:hypothetical protein